MSGWETSHDLEYSHVADGSRPAAPSSEYTFMADDEALHAKIRAFHLAVDGTFPPGSGVFAGAGSSPLLIGTDGPRIFCADEVRDPAWRLFLFGEQFWEHESTDVVVDRIVEVRRDLLSSRNQGRTTA